MAEKKCCDCGYEFFTRDMLCKRCGRAQRPPVVLSTPTMVLLSGNGTKANGWKDMSNGDTFVIRLELIDTTGRRAGTYASRYVIEALRTGAKWRQSHNNLSNMLCRIDWEVESSG